MNDKLIVEGLNVTFTDGKKTKNIITNLNLAAPMGKITSIVGESGSGKTMCAMAIFSLLPQNVSQSGKIFLGGEEISALSQKQRDALRGRQMVFIPQSGADFLNPAMRVESQIYESLLLKGKFNKNELHKMAKELLYEVDLDESVLRKYPHQLSGGMAQRVILAIGLSQEPSLIIADEPTRGVDEAAALSFIDKMKKLFGRAAIVLITHNIAIAKKSDFTYVMFGGEIMESGPSEEVLNSPRHPYTRALLASLPEHGFELKEKSREKTKEGCVYYHRCAYATELCQRQKPEFTQSERILRCLSLEI